MQVENKVRSERIVKILGEEEARQVIEMTILAPKSAAQVSKELGIPSRSVYRHINDLCEVGLLARDRSILIDSGGKCALYRSMVKSVGFRYEPLRNTIEVDLVPNDTILDKFLNFWKYMSSV